MAVGWGLGYEDGRQTGGSFYSSGPELTLEPWLGSWEDKMVEVHCEDQDIPLLPLQILPQEAGRPVCSTEELCLHRQDCPQIEGKYRILQSLPKQSLVAQDIISQLKKKERMKIFLIF